MSNFENFEYKSPDPEPFFFEEARNNLKNGAKYSKKGEQYMGYFRIPDMFKVTFRFKSLLPTNFNTYMMTFFEPPIMEDTSFMHPSEGHHNTVYTDVVTAIGGIFKDLVGGDSEKPTTSAGGDTSSGDDSRATSSEDDFNPRGGRE